MEKLSDKIWTLKELCLPTNEMISTENVKQFIKDLKERIVKHDSRFYDDEEILRYIDELAGEELTK